MPWHIRIGLYARAFVEAPRGFAVLALYLRGWRPFQSICVSPGRWWSKPSPNQQRLEQTA